MLLVAAVRLRPATADHTRFVATGMARAIMRDGLDRATGASWRGLLINSTFAGRGLFAAVEPCLRRADLPGDRGNSVLQDESTATNNVVHSLSLPR